MDDVIPVQALRSAFLPAILHGDERHRAWLADAVECFIAGRSVPSPTGKGSANDNRAALWPGLDHIANFLNALDTAGMTAVEVRSAVYSECLEPGCKAREAGL